MRSTYLLIAGFAFFQIACNSNNADENNESIENNQSVEDTTRLHAELQQKMQKYVKVSLKTDVSKLSDNDKQLIPLFIEVAGIMDELFWMQSYGNKDSLMQSLNDPMLKEYVSINYGPWDRLDGNKSFVEGVGEKPKGANFYPKDMTVEEFENAEILDKSSQYTILRRDSNGKLISIPYREAYSPLIQKAAKLLREAAEIADNAELKHYLNKRAEAFLTDEYYESDLAWMDMQGNSLDFIVGPIENYEDQLFGYKTAYESYLLVKDKEWSKKLEKYTAMLPKLQKNLPVKEKYKTEKPGSDSQLAAFDVIYYSGDCNAGSKTIAVNLPNDEKVQLEKGTRRSQLKNAMRAKFEKILLPISEVLIDSSQRKHISFDAFFANTMFHEVAHGLGIKETINGKGSVREALKDHASALEEGKADVLGLYMITQLHEEGELTNDLKEYYTTFIASIFRSVRFGASSAHGKANMIRFNYFLENGAFHKNEYGTYTINYDKMKDAMNGLTAIILQLQGDGDYEGVDSLVKEKGNIQAELQKDLDKLQSLGIPVDVVFEQGVDVLGI